MNTTIRDFLGAVKRLLVNSGSTRPATGLVSNRVLAAAAGALVALGCLSNAPAQTVYTVNIVGLIANKTTYLLSAPLTTRQRQTLHAQNFNQLPASARPLYLRAVAYAVGSITAVDVAYAVGSTKDIEGESSLSAAALADYL